MNLIVSEAEIVEAARGVAKASEALVRVSEQYVSYLRSLEEGGYASEAMEESIEARCGRVEASRALFEQGVQEVLPATRSFIAGLAEIDRLG